MNYIETYFYWIYENHIIIKPIVKFRLDDILSSIKVNITKLSFSDVNDISGFLFYTNLDSNFVSNVDNMITNDYVHNKIIDNYTILVRNTFNNCVDNFPNSLKYLMFNEIFNCLVENLPQSLEKLIFSWEFNKPVNNLPLNLQELVLGHKFNKSVDILPSTLILLKFGFCFNKYVDDLPYGLKKLFFGREFNKSVDNLPNTLTHLYFSEKFSQTINNLPPSIIWLCLGENFNHSLDNLPSMIEKLIFLMSGKKDFSYSSYSFDNLPNSINQIVLPICYDLKINNIPSSLKTIFCSEKYLCDYSDEYPNINVTKYGNNFYYL